MSLLTCISYFRVMWKHQDPMPTTEIKTNKQIQQLALNSLEVARVTSEDNKTIQSTKLCFFFQFYLFLERGKGREKKGETHPCVRKTWIGCLPLARPQPGTWPITQACVLTRNWICNLSVCERTSNPLSHTSQAQSTEF